MTVLLVSESYFGNTLTVAKAIAAGLVEARGQEAVTLARPSEAPIGSDVDLLLVGAPTHNFSMPKEQTRKQAAAKGATGGDRVGIREWIERVTPRTNLRVVTFDTSLKTKFTPGSASNAAFKALKKCGFRGPNEGRVSSSAASPGLWSTARNNAQRPGVFSWEARRRRSPSRNVVTGVRLTARA